MALRTQSAVRDIQSPFARRQRRSDLEGSPRRSRAVQAARNGPRRVRQGRPAGRGGDHEAPASYPSLSIGEFGDASVDEQLNKQVGKDFAKAGTFSLPVTLLVLIVAFGALIAAGLPLLLGLTAVAATIGLVALPSHLFPMDQNVSVVVMLIGLAVGVDYSMFYLKREREERRAGLGDRAALEAAAATSGRAVLVSGLTVIVAMAGMLLTGDPTFESFGMATIIVVGVAVLGSLTVLPALLSKLGDKVDKPRIPLISRRRRSRTWREPLLERGAGSRASAPGRSQPWPRAVR